MTALPLIEVAGLSKRYWLGAAHNRPDTILGAVTSWLAAPMRKFRELRRLSAHADASDEDVLWALRDVSFDVEQGDVIGVVGRNGAGKSTLLKILSRITEPTAGSAVIRGRIASLLEVGTGFHPELTGRENVYLNGTVLGMRRAEIARKFDEIVEFAGIARFIDMPIKRYSSGMQVRLAFSVAAHLEPEILIIDEVLAVGDMAFQKKCLGKMETVASEGRTVLFVSHSMQMVDALCPRSIMLENGRLVADGVTRDVLARYHESLREVRVGVDSDVSNQANRRGSGAVRFSSVDVSDDQGVECYRFHTGETVRFRLAYEVLHDVPCLHVSVQFRSGNTREILAAARHVVSHEPLRRGERGVATVVFPNLALKSGTYPLYFWLGDQYARAYDVVDDLTMPLSVYSVHDEPLEGVFHVDSVLSPDLDPAPVCPE